MFMRALLIIRIWHTLTTIPFTEKFDWILRLSLLSALRYFYKLTFIFNDFDRLLANRTCFLVNMILFDLNYSCVACDLIFPALNWLFCYRALLILRLYHFHGLILGSHLLFQFFTWWFVLVILNFFIFVSNGLNFIIQTLAIFIYFINFRWRIINLRLSFGSLVRDDLCDQVPSVLTRFDIVVRIALVFLNIR